VSGPYPIGLILKRKGGDPRDFSLCVHTEKRPCPQEDSERRPQEDSERRQPSSDRTRRFTRNQLCLYLTHGFPACTFEEIYVSHLSH
jgi:hypothetical protein